DDHRKGLSGLTVSWSRASGTGFHVNPRSPVCSVQVFAPGASRCRFVEVSSLAQPFLREIAVPLRAGFSNMRDLEERLAALVADARSQWPGLDLDPALFVAFVAARLPADRDPDAAL